MRIGQAVNGKLWNRVTGMRFAQLEMKVCIARLMSTFNVRVNKKTVQPIEFDPVSFFVTPKDGLWLDFGKRVKV